MKNIFVEASLAKLLSKLPILALEIFWLFIAAIILTSLF